jgi:phage terminase small subunit
MRSELGIRLKHARFVCEYLIDLNATAAYKRTGYRARGHAAEANASRLLKRPDVRRAVQVVAEGRSHRSMTPSAATRGSRICAAA